MVQTKELLKIDISRYIGGKNSQLICFCDASKNVYVTAIYLKTLDQEEDSRVTLIFSNMMGVIILVIGISSLKFISKEMVCKVLKELFGQIYNAS